MKPDLGNHAHVLTTLIEQGKVVNVVGYRTKGDKRWNDSAWVKPTTKEEMLAEFDGWSKPIKSILGLIEKVDMWALFDHLPAATYHRKGKICLLGDSAHEYSLPSSARVVIQPTQPLEIWSSS